MSFKEDCTLQSSLYRESPDAHAEHSSKRRRLSSASSALSSAPSSFGSDVSDGCLTPPTHEFEITATYSAATGSESDWLGSAVASSSRHAPRTTAQARAAQSHDSITSRSKPNLENEQLQLHGSRASSATSSCTSLSSIGSGDSDYEPAGAAHSEPAGLQAQRGNGSSEALNADDTDIRAVPLDYDLALIGFIARDAALRAFMTTGAATGVMAILERFYKLKGGSKPKAINIKMSRWRGSYRELRESLSVAARSAPTAAWSEEDLEYLHQFEKRRVHKVLKMIHDEIYVGSDQSSADVDPVASTQHSRDTSAPSKLLPKTDSSPAMPAQLRSSNRRDDAQHNGAFETVQGQITEQFQQLTHLQVQSEQQAQLIRQQGQLLQHHLSRAQRDSERSEEQSSRLKCIEKRLEALLASQQDIK